MTNERAYNMKNNNLVSLKSEIANTIDEYLEYVDGYKINLIATYLNFNIYDKYDYGSALNDIKYYCNVSLSNSIIVLNFINNDYK